MEFPVVRAKERPFRGKGFARKIRQLGYLPAVVYGQDTAARPLVVDPKTVIGVLRGARSVNTVVRLEIEKKDGKDECLAVIREYQVHPVKRNLEHCDFLIVDEKTEMTVKVPVRTTGRSEGEKAGAVLNIALREVAVRCKAGDVPEAIVVDVTALQVNQGISLSELPYPAGTRPVYVKDRAVVTVRMPKAEKTEAAAEGEAAPAEGEAAPAAEGEEGKAEPAAESPKK